MKNLTAFSLVLITVCTLGSCNNQSPTQKETNQGNTNNAFEIASDSRQHINTRFEAVSHLNQDQKKRLQSDLLAKIPGDLDVTTLNAINLLARIGDLVAADKLNQFLRSSVDMPGKIGAATESAIAEIHKRG